MKQHSTLKQWNELSIKEKAKFLSIKLRELDTPSEIETDPLPDIGDEIEFIGDDLESLTFMNGHWTIILTDETHFTKKELYDALWEAVKYKLKHCV